MFRAWAGLTFGDTGGDLEAYGLLKVCLPLLDGFP